MIDYSSEHKKAKVANKNVVARINHSKCKNVLLNNKCFRHSMKRIKLKNYKRGTYKINNI